MNARMLLVAAVCILAGCSRHHGEPDTARAAVAIALAWVEAGMPGPDASPAPGPDTSDVCWNCSGRGQVGDGRTMLTCRVCNGSGRATTSYGDPSPADESTNPVAADLVGDDDAPELAEGPHDAGEGDGSPPATEAAIDWHTDQAEALRIAATTGEAVAAVCSPDWFKCGPCKQLAERLRPLAGVVYLKTSLTKAQTLKLQEKRRLEETSFPYLVVLSPYGEAMPDGQVKPTVLGKGPVSADPQSVTPILERALEKFAPQLPETEE